MPTHSENINFSRESTERCSALTLYSDAPYLFHTKIQVAPYSYFILNNDVPYFHTYSKLRYSMNILFYTYYKIEHKSPVNECTDIIYEID